MKNNRSEKVDVSGWVIRDAAGYTYMIPSGTTVAENSEMTVYTGSGEDTDTELYMGASRAVWNNGGDDVIVRDETGNVVIETTY